MSVFVDAVRALPAVSLADLDAEASLQTRIDRKYIVAPELVDELVSEFDGSALDIDDRRQFGYRTTYYDTPDLDLYRDTAYRRPKRFKLRVREYVDSGLVMIEVKTKNGRGKTVKHRTEYVGAAADLPSTARAYAGGLVDSDLVAQLAPTLVTSFSRTTLLDADGASRYTLDHGLVATANDGRTVAEPVVIVECKSAGATSSVDRWLWSAGVRPSKMSKYCTSLAVLDPSLPANHWHRTLKRHFVVDRRANRDVFAR